MEPQDWPLGLEHPGYTREVEDLRQAYVSNPTTDNLVALMTQVQSSEVKSPKFPSFGTIWNAVNSMSKSATATEKTAMRPVFFLVLDIIEEIGDPWFSPNIDAIPYEFMEDSAAKARDIFGMNNQITAKLYLLLIFSSMDPKSSIKEFLNAGGSTQDLKHMFRTQVPRPDTGLFVDTNLDEDSIRDIRYFFTFSLILRETGQFNLAQRSLQVAHDWSTDAQVDQVYQQRRGPAGSVIDLVLNHARILRELADLTQERGLEAEPLSYIAQSAALELGQRQVLCLDDAYVAYLRFVSIHPGFGPLQLNDLLSEQPLAARHVSSVAAMIRIKALLAARNTTDNNMQRATQFLNFGLQFTQEQLANLDHNDITEAAFESTIELSIYKIALEQLRITLLYSRTNSGQSQMEAYLELIKTVRQNDLEDVADSMYTTAFARVTEVMDSTSRTEGDMPVATRALFERAADEILGGDRDSWQTQITNESFAPVSADFFEVLARFYLRRGDLANFLPSLLTSLYLENLHKKKMPRDAGLEEKAQKVLGRLEASLGSHAEENGQFAKLADFVSGNQHELFLLSQINSQAGDGTEEARAPASLMEQTKRILLANFTKKINLLKQCLAITVVQQAME